MPLAGMLPISGKGEDAVAVEHELAGQRRLAEHDDAGAIVGAELVVGSRARCRPPLGAEAAACLPPCRACPARSAWGRIVAAGAERQHAVSRRDGAGTRCDGSADMSSPRVSGLT